MLAAIRAFAKSPFATVLLGLLVVSFGVWGIRDVFRNNGFSDAVVKAGSRPPVTSTQFKTIFNNQKTQREQQAGRPITNDDVVKFGLDRSLVDELATSEATSALMSSEGINPSDQLVADEIHKIKAFFSPITGQFDKDTYLRELNQAGLTPADLDTQLRDTVAQRHYTAALAAGMKAPRIYSLVAAAYQKEGRDFTSFTLEPRMVETVAKPTDAQLVAYMKDNAQTFTKPEMRQLSIVRFSAAELAKTLPVNEAEVQKRFDFEKDSLSQPEKRTIVQITVKTPAQGQAVAAKLKTSEDPMAIARETGAVANSYQAQPKSAIVDQKLADAAFAMKAGDVSAPIQGAIGMAVLKVTDIVPAKVVTLADVRAKIEDEVKQAEAKEKIYDLVQKYDDAHSGGASMPDAAKAAGQQVVTLPPMNAQAATMTGQRANLPPKILQQAFTLPQGGENDPMDLGQGEYWVVHVDKVIAPTLLGLDETVAGTNVRDAVTKRFMLQELLKRLQAKADALTAEIAKGKTIEAVAAEVGATVNHATNVDQSASRPIAPNTPPAYSPDLIGRLFQAKLGAVVVGEDTKPALIVAKVTKIQEPSPGLLAGMAERTQLPASRALLDDLAGATRAAAQRKIKPTVDYKRARQAIGIDPDAK